MEIKKVYDQTSDGEMEHVNWCLYRGEFDCIQDTLSFANYLKGFRRRDVDGTIHPKMASLKYWYEYLCEIGKDTDDYITLEEQVGFVDYLDRQENKQKVKPMYVVGKTKYGTGFEPGTTIRHQSNVHEYYQYLNDRGRTSLKSEDFPFKVIIAPKDATNDKPLPKTIANSDVRRMVAACTCLRDKLIVVMMFTVGLRLGELCSLTMRVINFADGTIDMDNREYLDLETGTLKTGPRRLKGNKLLFDLLHKYCLFERDRVARCDNLFVNLSRRGGAELGGPMNDGAIKALFKRIKKKTGLKVCYPHALRHTFATNFLRLKEKNDKITIAKLQKILGHKDLRTTMIYTHLDYTDYDKEIGADFDKLLYDCFGKEPETW